MRQRRGPTQLSQRRSALLVERLILEPCTGENGEIRTTADRLLRVPPEERSHLEKR